MVLVRPYCLPSNMLHFCLMYIYTIVVRLCSNIKEHAFDKHSTINEYHEPSTVLLTLAHIQIR